MAKLTEQKIRWLIAQVVTYGRPPSAVAPVQGVTTRRVRQLVGEFRATGEYPVLKEPGRPETHLHPEQHAAIEAAWEETRLSPRLLYHELRRRGARVPKNKLYAYLRATRRVVPNKRKQQRRSRCRYERAHSGSLVHGDWHRTSQEHPYCIVWLDDASRRILAGHEDAHISGRASILSFETGRKAALESNVQLRQANTDRGSEFYARKGGTSAFQAHLAKQGVKHVVSRPYNPQTNGKIERLWLEYDRHRWRFDRLDEWIAWYNARLHGALRLDWAETPSEAWWRKMRPEELIGVVFK